ncbi:MAG TPA: VCBS repeat-containing protein [Terriglobales bacterium]|nr:VCBS repeat-containing protein [Terriglobales bacterium]
MFKNMRLGALWLVCILFFLVVAPRTALTAANPFNPAPGSPITTGTGATFVATGDLNGDGKPDMVVVNSGANNISILLGTGGGSFTAPVNIAVGNSPADVAIGDVNGDGRPDLVVTNQSSDTVSVLLNVGGGAFGAPTNLPLPAGSGPEGVAIADVDGNGAKDIIVSNAGSNSVVVFLGTGFGTFSGAILSTTGSAPSGVAVADFNGDGKLDLATSNNDGTASILLGLGNGSFLPVTNINLSPSATSTCSDPDAIAVADLNGDSKTDIAIACTGGTVSILLGNGNGTFATPVSYSTINGNAGSGPEAIAIADFDGANGPDVVIADTSNAAVILLNNGNGTFGTATASSTVCATAGNGAFGVATADFNADGKADLAVANSIAGTVSVLLNSGSVTSGTGCSSTPPPTGPPANFTVTGSPKTITTTAGTLVTYTVTVTHNPGFAESVALTCNSAAPNSGCSFNPKSLTPRNGLPVNGTMSVATNFRSAGGATFGQAAPPVLPGSHKPTALFAALSLGGAGIFGLVFSAGRNWQKRRRWIVAILGILMILIALQGCGGKGNFPDGGKTITPPGTYTVTITGSAPGPAKTVQSASDTVSLIVQ